MASLLLSIYQRQIYYFILFSFKLTNGENVIYFFTNIESVYLFYFQTQHFADN